MKTYIELEEKMTRLSSPGIRPGLERIRRLLDLLGNPEEAFPAVHIVGTNGKGSVSEFISAIFRESGYSVAMYTSPHLENPSERLLIDGTPVGLSAWENAVTRIETALMRDAILKSDPPSFFEIVTTAAFLLTAERNVDIAVMEAGLGGRLDATNCLKNVLVTVVTSISMDHMEYLGDTLEKISDEKFSVMRPGAPCIFSGDPDSLVSRFRSFASGNGTPGYLLSDLVSISSPAISLDETSFVLKSKRTSFEARIITPLLGTYQIQNGALSAAACIELSPRFPRLSTSTILSGFRKARWPGRLERFGTSPVVLLDGAHNTGGMKRLVESIRTLLPGENITVLFAAMRDKDYRENLRLLSDITQNLVCTTVPGMERAAPAEMLLSTARSFHWNVPPSAWDDPVAAFHELLKGSEYILCCGSLYFIGFIRPHIRRWSEGVFGE